MKKINVLISVSVFPIILASGMALADSAASADSSESADPAYDTSMPSDQNYDQTNPNSSLYRTDYDSNSRRMRDGRNHRTMMECASTDLECMHNIKTGRGQQSY